MVPRETHLLCSQIRNRYYFSIFKALKSWIVIVPNHDPNLLRWIFRFHKAEGKKPPVTPVFPQILPLITLSHESASYDYPSSIFEMLVWEDDLLFQTFNAYALITLF